MMLTRRTTYKDVTFQRPFSLAGVDETFPAGVYATETDEELIQGLSFVAYRRLSTIIHLHSTSTNKALARSISIRPGELDDVMLRDVA